MYQVMLQCIVALTMFSIIPLSLLAVYMYKKRSEEQAVIEKEVQEMSKFNNIIVYEDNKAYFVHEILDFEETIKESDDIYVTKVGSSPIKKVIEWCSYNGDVEKLSDEDRIVAQIIPSKPLEKEMLEKVMALIKETREYEEMRKQQVANERLYETYKKANHSEKRLHDTNKFEKTMTDYNESLLSECEESEKRIKDNYENMSRYLNEYSKRQTNG